MASNQQVKGAVQFSDKEEAAIKEAVKEAKNLLENSDNAKARQDLVTGVMKNSQHRGIMLNKTHNWKGHFLSEPPKIMGESGAFVHQGATEPGQSPIYTTSKGAIVYGTFDMMYPGLGWLLAWIKPNNSNVSKVYVEAGNISKFVNMGWSEIEAKLDASGNRCRYWDSETGAAAAAEITNYGGDVAVLGATFDRFDA